MKASMQSRDTRNLLDNCSVSETSESIGAYFSSINKDRKKNQRAIFDIKIWNGLRIQPVNATLLFLTKEQEYCK